jgi:hypothetical protein
MSGPDLPGATRTALKEWAIACEALGRGDQILLLRKGGIAEERKHFRIEHAEFLLFPTYEHQRADLVKPPARAELEALTTKRGSADRVELKYWARAAEVFTVSEVEQLAALGPLHLWSEDYALERLRWKPRHPLHVVALRVYRLAAPRALASRPEYGGCKSWLTLAEEVVLEGASPVLDDGAFAEQLERVRAALGRTAVEVAP